MNKNVLKKIFIFFILIIVLFSFSYAHPITDYFKGSQTHSLNPTLIRSNILGILKFLGYGIAVCVVMITGIQFLTANAQKKAQLKEKLWLIAIGVFILAAGIPIYETIREALISLR